MSMLGCLDNIRAMFDRFRGLGGGPLACLDKIDMFDRFRGLGVRLCILIIIFLVDNVMLAELARPTLIFSKRVSEILRLCAPPFV